MQTNFNQFLDKYRFKESYTTPDELTRLITWCNENVSSDITYFDEPSHQYQSYLRLVENYLDHFLPYVPDDLTKKVPEFNNVNAVYFAARNGYDRFLQKAHILSTIINEADDNKMTPLHLSASFGYLGCVQALLAKGADVHIPNANQELPLHRALLLPVLYNEDYPARKEAIFRELWKQDRKTLISKTNDGSNTVHYLANTFFSSLLTEVVKKHPELARQSNNAGEFPIHVAILNQQVDAVRVLLDLPGVSDLKAKEGRVPLHYAALYSGEDILAACCTKTQNCNVGDHEGKSPLLLAAEVGNIAAMDFLLEKGADPLHTDALGNNLLHLAYYADQEEVEAWVIAHNLQELLSMKNDDDEDPESVKEKKTPSDTFESGRHWSFPFQ